MGRPYPGIVKIAPALRNLDTQPAGLPRHARLRQSGCADRTSVTVGVASTAMSA
jgi:hypothetical protein